MGAPKIISGSMFADDIIATGTAECPVGVECSAQGRSPRPLAHGWLKDEWADDRFQLYAADYTVLETYAVRTTGQAGVFIEVNLGDPQTGHAGRHDWELDTGTVVAVAIQEPVKMLTRRPGSSRQVRCGISLDLDAVTGGRLGKHLVANASVQELITSHMRPRIMPCSPSVLTAARRVMAAMTDEGSLGSLRRAAAGMELLAETLALACPDERPETRHPSKRDVTWVIAVREALDALGPQDPVVIADLAALAGMSVRSLCRNFRTVFGTSLVAYVAQSRMEKARIALEREGASIDFAAFLAGFAHTTNFATAFRRRYGYTPGSAAACQRRKVGRFT